MVGELDAVGGGVLLDTGHPPGPGNRGDVLTLREQPRQGDLSRRRIGLLRDGRDLVHDAQVAVEVLAGEPGVSPAPVVVGNVVLTADLAGEEAVTRSVTAPAVSSIGVPGSTRCW